MKEHVAQADGDGSQESEMTAVSDGDRSKSVSRRRFGYGVLGGLVALVAGGLARPERTQAAIGGGWSLSGNAGTTPAGGEFLGTTDNQPILFKTTGVERMRVGKNGGIGVGIFPSMYLDVLDSAGDALYAIQGISNATVANSAAIHGRGTTATEGAGVLGTSNHTITNSYGVKGTHSGAGKGVQGINTSGNVNGVGVAGSARTGVSGFSPVANGIGVFGSAGAGANSRGVNGISGNGFAGYFEGKVHVTGVLTKGSGAFLIDHPLDPANRYLSHSFVESPDMKNVYDGVALLGRGGRATVQMPDWFEALNMDFRYQLTCIGKFAPVYIEREMAKGSFRIGGGVAGQRVSWQVTGTRQDAFAKANRIVVETDKPADERGTYLYPVEAGRPVTEGRDHRERVRSGHLLET